MIALHCYDTPFRCRGQREVGDHIERADHGTHAAGDAFMGVDQNDVRIVGCAMEGCRWADSHARGGIAVPALVGKSGVQRQTRFRVDARFGRGRLKNGQE